MTSEAEVSAAVAKDNPAVNTAKEEPFDDYGYIKGAFKRQFVPLPNQETRERPGIARVIEPEGRVYSMPEIVDILEETHKTHHEHFEEGVALLRAQMEVTHLTIL